MNIAQFTIDLMKTSIFWVNEKGIIENINQSTCRALGYRRLELLGLPISKIDPKLKDAIWQQYWNAIKAEKKTDFETEYFTKLGQAVPVKIEAFYADLPEEKHIVLRAKDWTISSRYRQLFEVTEQVAKMGAWDWNLETNEVLNTREVYNIYDLDPDAMLNPDLGFQSFEGADLEEVEKAFEATRNHKTPFDLILNFKSATGKKKIVQLSGIPKIFNNKVVKIQGIIQDVTDKKRIERLAYLKDTTIETIGDLIFWVTMDGSFFFVNNAVVENSGFSKEEMYAQFIWDIIQDYSKEKWLEDAAKLKEKKRFRFTNTHHRKDGSTYPTDTELTYLEYQGKEYICAVVRNETVNQVYQEQLKLIEFTVDQAGEMIFWLNEQGDYIYVNEKVCATYGYSRAELLQMNVYDIARDFKKKDWKLLWEALKKNKQLDLPTIHYRKDGSMLDVEISANFIDYAGQAICCSFVKDVTQKNKIEQRIQLTNQTIEQAGDIILWTDPNSGELIYFNQAVEQQLGYTKKEFYNLKNAELIANYNKAGQKTYRKKLTDTKQFIGECVLTKKDGSKIVTELKSSVVAYGGKKINCSIFRDISARKKREEELQQVLQENLQLKESLEAENTYLNEELKLNHNFDDIISTSPKYAAILSKIEEVANTEATVLITGETGTGKELLARAVHQLSDRSNRPLVKINCAALPENLIESELFGHEKGAFTGAVVRKIGRFELAHEATLFLDEIGELPIELQPKLLRVLQEGEFTRLGSNKTLHTNVRIIAATNRHLPSMVKEGTFREDLFYRLNVYPIHNIPLRERKEDIPLLVKYFLKKFNDRIGRKVSKVSARSLTKLQAYDYPGNIRELENIIERAVITSKTASLDLSSWKPTKEKNTKKDEPFLSFAAMERKHIVEALQRTNWKVSGEDGAAALLGLNGKTLDSKMRKLKIKRANFMIK